MRTDAELLRAARTDAHAFRKLYDRHVSRIYGYHLRRSGDADAAHDLTAETFAQAWLARRRFRDRAAGSAVPWLFGIARNVLLMSVRRRRLERSGASGSGSSSGSTASPLSSNRTTPGSTGWTRRSPSCRTASATRSAFASARISITKPSPRRSERRRPRRACAYTAA